MGLEAKRAQRAAIDGWMPKMAAELEKICGGAIPAEVDWDSFGDDAKGISWLEANGPFQVNAALRPICRDDLGQEAVRETVQRVVYRNVATIEEKALSFESGVLELRCAFSQSPRGRFSDREIRECLMAHL